MQHWFISVEFRSCKDPYKEDRISKKHILQKAPQQDH